MVSMYDCVCKCVEVCESVCKCVSMGWLIEHGGADMVRTRERQRGRETYVYTIAPMLNALAHTSPYLVFVHTSFRRILHQSASQCRTYPTHCHSHCPHTVPVTVLTLSLPQADITPEGTTVWDLLTPPHTHIHARTHTHSNTYTYLHTHTHTYKYTHTHTGRHHSRGYYSVGPAQALPLALGRLQ
jgi:hypothetical protein